MPVKGANYSWGVPQNNYTLIGQFLLRAGLCPNVIIVTAAGGGLLIIKLLMCLTTFVGGVPPDSYFRARDPC
jgi:hypothetical protein